MVGAPTSTYDTTRSITDSIYTAAYGSPAVPIGFSGGPKAFVDGRLFNINGKTQYFAGISYTVNSLDLLLTKTRSQHMVVGTS